MIRAVVFDVGETLVDETRIWSLLAERAGVTPLTLFAALGWLIAEGADHRDVWELLGVKAPSTDGIAIERADLYPDALGCLAELSGRGLPRRRRRKPARRCRGTTAGERRGVRLCRHVV